MPFVFPFESIDSDGDDPRETLERAESAKPESEMARQAVFVGKLLAWLIAAKDLNQIGLRVLVATSRIRPDVYPGASLGAMVPPQRLADLERDWTQNFPGISSRGSPTGKRDPATRGAARR